MVTKKISEAFCLLMDYVEEAFGQMTIMQGRRTWYVLYVCIGLTGFSAILELLGYYTFISLPEGIIASAFAATMTMLDFRNARAIKNIRLRFKAGDKDERQ